MVTVSKQYFPVFGLYIVQYARRTSWLSLGLGLAFSIFSLGLNTKQLRKKDVLALARVRVSSQYFTVARYPLFVPVFLPAPTGFR